MVDLMKVDLIKVHFQHLEKIQNKKEVAAKRHSKFFLVCLHFYPGHKPSFTSSRGIQCLAAVHQIESNKHFINRVSAQQFQP